MTSARLLEIVPFWAIVAGIELIVLGSILVGVLIGRVQRRREKEGDDTPAGTVVGATLGLLAFILAFTFGMTASRFDVRKQALLDEVNAIETTFLRAGLIPEPHRGEVRALLKRYVDIRVDLIRDPSNVQQVIAESDSLQRELWSHAVTLADADLENPVMIGLFVQSLNEMFDLQTKRVTVGLYYRVPTAIWLALLGITVVAMIQVGYLSGRSRSINWTFVIALSLAFSAVVVLIADLDRAGSTAVSTIRVSQQPVIDLQRRLSE